MQIFGEKKIQNLDMIGYDWMLLVLAINPASCFEEKYAVID